MKMNKLHKILLASSFAMFSFAPLTQAESGITGEFGLGYSLGGEELGSMDYADGTSSSVNAGAGLMLYGGVAYTQEQYEVVGRIGYMFDSSKAEDYYGNEYEMKFTTYPLEGLVYFRTGAHRIGGGLAYHMSPSFSFESIEADFDDALGAEIAYRYVTKKYAVDVKYVSIEYDYESITFDGSGFSVGFSALFGG